jgi:hypothetical protein
MLKIQDLKTEEKRAQAELAEVIITMLKNIKYKRR